MAENKINWIRFQKTFGCGLTRGQKMLDRFGRPEEIFGKSMRDLAATGIFTAAEMKNMTTVGSEEAARKVLEFCEKGGCQVLTPDDDEYPVSLRQVYNRPAVLYVRGSLAGLDESLAIAMVGTRQPTEYGLRAAEFIAGRLAEKGAVIVSGLARGIDTASHTAALRVGGRTIAVLGCGIDIAYPAENAQLKELIVHYGGAVVTEFPPGEQPLHFHFPIRNRVISGISNGVVIVEGTRRSGSLITASHAYAQNRDVFAVPGSIFSSASEGPNYLLSQYAKAVDSVESILEEYECRIQWEPRKEEKKIISQIPLSSFEDSGKNGYNDERRSPRRERPAREPKASAPSAREKGRSARSAQQPLPDDLSETQRKVCEVLSPKEPYSADHIAVQSDLPSSAVLSALTQLELFGLVKSHPGRRFTRV